MTYPIRTRFRSNTCNGLSLISSLFVAASCTGLPACAQTPQLTTPAVDTPPPVSVAGSPNFCLLTLPGDGNTVRYVNLGIVQYLEASERQVMIVYGGGNLGSGHEAKLPVKSLAEAVTMVATLQRAAQDCGRSARP